MSPADVLSLGECAALPALAGEVCISARPQRPAGVIGFVFNQRRTWTAADDTCEMVLSDALHDLAAGRDVAGYVAELRARLPQWGEADGLDVSEIRVGVRCVVSGPVPAMALGPSRSPLLIAARACVPGEEIRVVIRNRNAYAVDVRAAAIVRYID